MTSGLVGIAGVVMQAGAHTAVEAADERVRQALRAMQRRGDAQRVIHARAATGALAVFGVNAKDDACAGLHLWQDPHSRDVLAWSGTLSNKSTLHGMHALPVSGPDTMQTAALLCSLLRERGVVAAQNWCGAYAVAWWHAADGRLALWRDGFGQEPLYFCEHDGALVFASDLRAVIQMGVPRTIVPAALETYLFNGHSVAPDTVVKQAAAMVPGERCDWQGGKTSTAPIRSVAGADLISADEPTRLAGVQHALESTLARQLTSDLAPVVPLSSGLDSCWLAATLAHQRGGRALRTVSIAFEDAQYDESRLAEAVARHLDTEHHTFRLTAQHVCDELDAFISALDHPTYDGLNAFFAAKVSRELGADVLVSGLGGDELFGGFPETLWGPWLTRFDALAEVLPHGAERALAKVLARDAFGFGRSQQFSEPLWHRASSVRGRHRLAAYQAVYCLIPYAARRRLLGAAQPDAVYSGLPLAAAQRLAAQIADDNDQAAMMRLAVGVCLAQRTIQDLRSMSVHHGLTMRLPLLDDDFVGMVEQIPLMLRASTHPERPFQRKLVTALLDNKLLATRKRGFALPMHHWLRLPALRAKLNETLHDGRLVQTIGLNSSAVRELSARFQSGDKRVPWHSMWALFVLLRWCALHGVTQ
jgi:asparagine synthase (glutamine-hydrolysing)